MGQEIGTTLNLKMNRVFIVLFVALFTICLCHIQPNRLKTIIRPETTKLLEENRRTFFDNSLINIF